MGSLTHCLGGLTRHVVDLHDGLVDLLAGGRLLFTGRGNGPHLIRRGFHILHNLAQGFARLAGKAGGGFHFYKRLVHAADTLGRTLLNRLDGIAHILGGRHGLFSQLAHLIGNHGKSPPGVAGACGLNGGIERQQVGLIRDI